MSDLFEVEVTETCDKQYNQLRESSRHRDLRDSLEVLWKTFEPYADANFRKEFATSFQPRFWEMYLGCTLLDNNFPLVKMADRRRAGPDFLMEGHGCPRTWIEAIAPDSGSGPDAVPPMYGENKPYRVPEDAVILRLRHAIWEKYKAYRKYLADGIVLPADSYVIAINGYSVPFSELDDNPPFIAKAVYALGHHVAMIDKKSNQVVDEYVQHRPEVSKTNGNSVETNVFEEQEYKGISGIVYSRANAWHVPKRLGDGFTFLHNGLASAQLDRGWLKVGREMWFDNDQTNEHQWS